MRASQFTWDADTLAKYVTSPTKSLPGGKMKYDGLESESGRADSIAFLASQSSKQQGSQEVSELVVALWPGSSLNTLTACARLPA
jgi:hypothetical protein